MIDGIEIVIIIEETDGDLDHLDTEIGIHEGEIQT